jgi:uncharacterized membrane protein
MYWCSGIAILHYQKNITMANLTAQNNRLLSIDLARGLAVFFMIAVHTTMVFANQEVKNSVLGHIIEFLGGPAAAPVFMTLMGLSFIYSRQIELKGRLLRGIKILLSGYILNILMGVIPYTLSKHLEMDIYKTFPTEKLNEYTILTIVDILQFAGIALMIMALIQHFNVNRFIILFMAFLITMISPFLWGLKPSIPVIDQIMELFWGDQPIDFSFIKNKIAFPVFPWLSFPLLGMFLGYTLKNSQNQKMTFKYIGMVGLFVLLVGVAVSNPNMEYHFNDYYHSRQGGMLFMSGFVMLWLFINKITLDLVPMNSIFNLIFKWSRGVTNIYFAQWIIIIWSIAFFGINNSSTVTIVLLIFTFTFISHLVNELIIFIQRRK